jgi:hypothetical protein
MFLKNMQTFAADSML